MVYVGLSYYGPALGNEEHLSFFFSSLAEIPSYMACWVVMDRWGRRWPLCLCMVMAGVSCIATVLLSSGTRTHPIGLHFDLGAIYTRPKWCNVCCKKNCPPERNSV